METLSKITVDKAVEAADGFLRLGLPEEAWHELEFLPARMRTSKPVMEARLRVYKALEKWKEAAEVAGSLAGQFPEESKWWIEWAMALRWNGQLDEARGVMLRAYARYPEDAMLNYHLARLYSAAGKRKEAFLKLHKAFSLKPDLRESALDEADFASFLEGEGRVA